MRSGAARVRAVASRISLDAAPTFEQFYATHRGRIAQAVALTVGDAHLADDATSEAMIKAHLRWSEVSGYANPAGWTYRVAVNHARGWRRTLLRRRTTPGNVPETAHVDSMHEDENLAELLTQLPAVFRSVVVCRLFLDWSTEQTADALGIATGTVKSRLARALGQLRTMLEEP